MAAGIELRATHHYGFRSGEWAVLTGVEWWNDRPCFLVRFPDGKPDRWAVYDTSDAYEFRAAAQADTAPGDGRAEGLRDAAQAAWIAMSVVLGDHGGPCGDGCPMVPLRVARDDLRADLAAPSRDAGHE